MSKCPFRASAARTIASRTSVTRSDRAWRKSRKRPSASSSGGAPADALLRLGRISKKLPGGPALRQGAKVAVFQEEWRPQKRTPAVGCAHVREAEAGADDGRAAGA